MANIVERRKINLLILGVMKKIIYFSYPAEGHVNPSIKLCKMLDQKNLKIIYYTLPDQFEKFREFKNLELRAYPHENILNKYLAEAGTMSHKFGYTQYMLFDCTRNLIEYAIDEVKKEKPQLIMNDVFAMWGKIAAKYLKIPMAIFSCVFLMDPSISKKSGNKPPISELLPLLSDWPTMLKAMRIKRKLDKKYDRLTDSPMNFLSDQGALTVVTSTKVFHPDGELFGSNVYFIGNDVSQYKTDEVTEKDIIFVSIGTMYENKTIWNKVLRSVSDFGYKIVMVAYNNNIKYIDQSLVRDKVKIYNKLSLEEYQKYIRRAKVFINHGGMNSVTMSIMYHTPMLVCPNTFERHNTGKVVEKTKCGLTFKNQNFSEEMMRNAVAELINNAEVSKGLEKISNEFLKTSNCNEVVEEILNKLC